MPPVLTEHTCSCGGSTQGAPARYMLTPAYGAIGHNMCVCTFALNTVPCSFVVFFPVLCRSTGLRIWSPVSVGSSDRIRMIDLQPLLPPSMALPCHSHSQFRLGGLGGGGVGRRAV